MSRRSLGILLDCIFGWEGEDCDMQNMSQDGTEIEGRGMSDPISKYRDMQQKDVKDPDIGRRQMSGPISEYYDMQQKDVKGPDIADREMSKTLRGLPFMKVWSSGGHCDMQQKGFGNTDIVNGI